jgi:hypothetical protein
MNRHKFGHYIWHQTIFIFFSILMIVSSGSTSCKQNQGSQEDGCFSNVAVGYTAYDCLGTVETDYPPDEFTNNYYIRADDHMMLLGPIPGHPFLPEEFQQEGLRIIFTAIILEPPPYFRLQYVPVEIISIRKL